MFDGRKFAIQAVIAMVAAFFNDNAKAQKYKKWLVQLHDYIEFVFPELADSNDKVNAKRLVVAERNLAKDSENSV